MGQGEYGEDEKQIDELTEALYSSISFDEGESPDLEMLKSLFIREGMLINNNGDPLIMSINQFVDAVEEQHSRGELKSFYEGEIASRTEIFGKISHRFSTYGAKFDPGASEPFSIGINSIQFIEVGGSWRVASIIWNDQAEGRKIPEMYL